MKNYYRIMLGAKSIFVEQCIKENFIGVDFSIPLDFTNKFYHENWRDFNKENIPLFLKYNEGKTKIAAGLACGMLWTVCNSLVENDIVLCPDGKGSYFVGEIQGNYYFAENEILPHRRRVKWLNNSIHKSSMSIELQNSVGAIGTIASLNKHFNEIEKLISGQVQTIILSNDETIEDPSVFALEKHLEEFLIQNWKNTEIGKNYDIFEDSGEKIGQQYITDDGRIDILAISKDKKEILVIELKKGRASDIVVGQIQRYMGYVKEELAEKNQIVKGVIIAFENDIKIKRALSVAVNIDFYTYKISFKLDKV